jgi:hypothetical protein
VPVFGRAPTEAGGEAVQGALTKRAILRALLVPGCDEAWSPPDIAIRGVGDNALCEHSIGSHGFHDIGIAQTGRKRETK